jgi:hypothetical protein
MKTIINEVFPTISGGKMLSTVITTVTTTSTAASSAVSMTIPIGLGIGGAIIAIFLIMLLASKELITASPMDSKWIRNSLNILIIPLIVVFALEVVFRVTTII